MIKEKFIKRMKLIQNFHSQQDTLSKLINKLTDGYSVVSNGDFLVDEMVVMITEDLNCKNEDLLFWWLYEDVDKVIYYKDKEIIVRTLEELYDYIINN